MDITSKPSPPSPEPLGFFPKPDPVSSSGLDRMRFLFTMSDYPIGPPGKIQDDETIVPHRPFQPFLKRPKGQAPLERN